MAERALRLLRDARRRFAEGELRPTRDEARSLEGAVHWTARAMNTPCPDALARRGARLLALKYGSALLAGLAAAALAARRGGALGLVGFGAGFYAAEAQGVFVLPALLDGAARPYGRSRELVVRAGGTLAVMRTVVPLAASMLAGAPGPDPEAAWCAGCLAVVQWYRELAA